MRAVPRANKILGTVTSGTRRLAMVCRWVTGCRLHCSKLEEIAAACQPAACELDQLAYWQDLCNGPHQLSAGAGCCGHHYLPLHLLQPACVVSLRVVLQELGEDAGPECRSVPLPRPACARVSDELWWRHRARVYSTIVTFGCRLTRSVERDSLLMSASLLQGTSQSSLRWPLVGSERVRNFILLWLSGRVRASDHQLPERKTTSLTRCTLSGVDPAPCFFVFSVVNDASI